MSLTRYQPGPETVALLGADFVNEDGVAANADVSVRVRIIDELKAVVVDLTEPVGALVNIENPSAGRYQFRHVVTTNDPDDQHIWQHEWTTLSAVPPAPSVKLKPSCFLVEATDFPLP